MHEPVFCILGPTASGKTSLACELVKHFPFEIISVDSAMIYRDMNIGTAKPSFAELQQTPHHLIDIRNPNESYSVADFCADAKKLVRTIFQNNKIPLLVGGTMMYFNALQKGLSELPIANPELRCVLEKQYQELGALKMHQELTNYDPISASRIHPHDKQRLQRALEVYLTTNIPLSTYQSLQKPDITFNFYNIALMPQNRHWLHERIAERFKKMLIEGLIEEVKILQEKWLVNENVPAMRTVGYKQVFEYFNTRNYQLLEEKGIAATRQLAKRQFTWLKHWDNITHYDPQNSCFHIDVLEKIQEILDN